VAGVIAIGPDERWSAAGWPFCWVLRTIASEVDDDALGRRLDEIERENLGFFDVSECTLAQQAAIKNVTSSRLLSRAERDLAHVPDPPATLNVLQELMDRTVWG